MPDFLQIPGNLNITTVVGDEFGLFVDLDIDTTDFAWTSVIYEASTTISFTSVGGTITQGALAATLTVTNVNAANGQLNLSLTEVQTAALVPTTKYRWYLRGVSPALVTRTYLSGTFTAVAP